MAPCVFQGNTDMYGLGIRLGFYLQWFSSILASYLVPSRHRDHRDEDLLKDEIIGLRFANNVFAVATFLALFILIVGNVSSLQPVEIYLILLLTFGYSLTLIPIYIWRLLTGADPMRDPTRWPIVRPSAVESVLRFLLIAAVASFQLWFWFSRLPTLNGLSCQQYGFLFTRVRLNFVPMQVINVVLYAAVLIACVTVLVKTVYDAGNGSRSRRKRRKNRQRRVPSPRKRALQNLNNALGLGTAVVVVLAVELTIRWNHIRGVDTLASAGQTIPFAIGAAAAVRILYVYLFKDMDPPEIKQGPSRPHWGPEPAMGGDRIPIPLGPPFPHIGRPRSPEQPMDTNSIPGYAARPPPRRPEPPTDLNSFPAARPRSPGTRSPERPMDTNRFPARSYRPRT